MKQQKQSGFAHLGIITIILAVALVGTLGFVFYQNFMQNRDSVSKIDDLSKDTNNSNEASNENDNTETDTNKGYLVLEDWGVKFKLPTNLVNNKITYYRYVNDYIDNEDGYELSTSRVEAQEGSCNSGDEWFTALGLITRMTSPSTQKASAPILISKIDNYYYYYSSPQSSCGEEGVDTDIQLQDMQMIKSMLFNIEQK